MFNSWRFLVLLIIHINNIFPDSANMTVTGDSRGFVSDHEPVKIKITCSRCSNLTVIDPKNRKIQPVLNGSTAELQLKIGLNVTLGNYTWRYNGVTIVYSLLYRECTNNERVNWHLSTCGNRSKYETCVVTLIANGKETTCNSLTMKICRETHKYENITNSICVGNISYDTLCEAYAAVAYNKENGFITHVTDKFNGSCLVVLSPNLSLVVSVNYFQNNNCTSLYSNLRPYRSILLLGENESRVCFQCISDIACSRNQPRKSKSYFSSLPLSLELKEINVDQISLVFRDVDDKRTLGEIDFHLLSMKPRFRFDSRIICNQSNPILMCEIEGSNTLNKIEYSRYELRFKIDGRDVIELKENENFITVEKAGIYECIFNFYYYGAYWFEKFNVTRSEKVIVTEDCIKKSNDIGEQTTAVKKDDSSNLFVRIGIGLSCLLCVALIAAILFCFIRKIIQKRRLKYLTGSYSLAMSPTTNKSSST